MMAMQSKRSTQFQIPQIPMHSPGVEVVDVLHGNASLLFTRNLPWQADDPIGVVD